MKKFNNIPLLEEMVAKGYINTQSHPTLPLTIYKYSMSAQFERVWNEATCACRGLVMDNDYVMWNNAIEKFWNIEELPVLGIELPDEPYEIFEKVDGSCVEVFRYNGQLIVCTLGSFQSEQAKIAEELLHTKYSDSLNEIAPGDTFIFELVVPENRIVLNYGDERKLVLLAIRRTSEAPWVDNEEPFWIVKECWSDTIQKFDMTVEQLMVEKSRPDFVNKEGFVIKFANGFRVKVKYEEYFRLHRIMTGVNERFIWEFLKEGKEIPLDNVPDEFFKYVTEVKNDLQKKYGEIEYQASNVFASIYKSGESRKEFAMKALKSEYKSILFKMLENRPYAEIIWDMIRPEATGPKFSSLKKNEEEA